MFTPENLNQTENNETEFATGQHLRINGTVHQITDIEGTEITIAGEGTVSESYLKSGISVGKVEVC